MSVTENELREADREGLASVVCLEMTVLMVASLQLTGIVGVPKPVSKAIIIMYFLNKLKVVYEYTVIYLYTPHLFPCHGQTLSHQKLVLGHHW